jgi:hypothetical protein
LTSFAREKFEYVLLEVSQMFKKSLVVTMVAMIAASFAGTAFADIVCPDSSYCQVTFTDPAKNRVTIAPANGETFAATGITIRVYLKNCAGAPLVGVPAQEVVIFNSALCICPGGNIADAATDVNGCTTFSGTIRGGGCVENLTIFADGVAICTIPVKTNSPDHVPASPCFVDAADISGLAFVLGRQDRYDICKDYNESGPPTVNAGDVSFFAALLGTACQ